tara:strand:+ start:182 stop:553 length:372 start_codon:yes stop_codon:yes gene_type:complete
MSSEEEGNITIHVPDAPFRPGDNPVFDKWKWSPDDLKKPPIDCESEETSAHSRGLVRVIDDEGMAYGDWDPNLEYKEILQGLKHMVRLRIYVISPYVLILVIFLYIPDLDPNLHMPFLHHLLL